MSIPTRPTIRRSVSWNYINVELKGRAELQHDELDRLDRKSSKMLAGTGVVLGLLINVPGRLPGRRVRYARALELTGTRPVGRDVQ